MCTPRGQLGAQLLLEVPQQRKSDIPNDRERVADTIHKIVRSNHLEYHSRKETAISASCCFSKL
eukprot:2475291-Pleurochrysis_carterae.AAC.1